METIKKIDEITVPDFRSTTWVKLDRASGTAERITLEDSYRVAEYFQLHDGVPAEIRSYMDSVRTLFIYGWFYYPFYTFAGFLGTTAVEMALRVRFPKPGRDFRGLKKLFRQAVKERLVRDENFASREHARTWEAAILAAMREGGSAYESPPERPYAEVVEERLRRVRNEFAHPEAQWIMVPGQAISVLVLCAEVINQLWSASA